MEYFKDLTEILFLDGRKYAEEIRQKKLENRKMWEKAYLWFHDNFELIIIIGGFILLGLLIFSYMNEDNTCNNKKKQYNQKGGEDTPSKFIPKTEEQVAADAEVEAAKQRAADRIAGKLEPEKTTNQKMRTKFLSKKAEANIANAKEAIKGAPGKAFTKVVGKTSAAWQSVKSGEALELGKEKFENAVGDAETFAKQHAKAGYALVFTTFMVIGFGLFFVPTLIMFVIGAVTLMIFNKQKMQFFSSI